MFDESKKIVNNIRNKRKHYVLTDVKLKKDDDGVFLFLDEHNNIVDSTSNLNIVNEVVKKLLNLDYFIEFL